MFLADKKLETIVEETPINRKAAYQISKLHEKLLEDNFVGKDLEVFLTRLLFCLFADDTGIFGEDGQFTRYIQNTREDGSDTGSALATLFQVLNTAHDKRQTSLDERLKAFEYVNGSLFAERTEIPFFNTELRKILIDCAKLDWSDISPAIFGAMFQAVLEENATDNKERKETRRELGAHYTSERNILKVIQPLFLDGLWQEYEAAKNNKPKLTALYDKLPTLTFFDPACGCGNFLVVAYRELRKFENEIIGQLFFKSGAGGLLDVATLCRVNVGQFYGIEIDDAAAHIARVAMYITDHQSNLLAASKFGATRATVPLITTPHIHFGNALTTDWNEVLQAKKCNYVLGNPPFVGAKFMTDEQREDVKTVYYGINNAGLLDFVAAWYVKASEYIKETSIEVAFVSTSSITQGEQVAVLWGDLFKKGVQINFAHRNFRWSNEGKAVAAVYCVIIGFALNSRKNKLIYDYENGKNVEAIEIKAEQINAYLTNAPIVLLINRSQPVSNIPEIKIGNKPIDGGYYLFTKEEKDNFIKSEPASKNLFRKWVGADEFVNNTERYCLWLGDCKPEQIQAMPNALKRVQAVRDFRLASKSAPTNKIAATPTRFHVENFPNTNFLVIPKVQTDKRLYIPIGFMDADVFASDLVFVVANAKLFNLSVLSSSMHMAWMRSVCGRLGNSIRYSAGIVYNNFIWPDNTDEQNDKLTRSAQSILDARALYPTSSLATLYAPVTMPPELNKAHEANNKAVDKAYGYKGADDDASRVAFLFKLYEQTTSLLPSQPTKKTRVKKVH